MPFWHRGDPPSDETGLRLIVGLGNPGAQYEKTRHNVGFMVVNDLARRMSVTFRRSRHRADTARGSLEGTSVVLAQPTTFMNDSGIAVTRLVNYFHVPLSNVLIVTDDLDLPFGTLRLRPSGSSGGHNGLKSVVAHLGSSEFTRLRVGVGRPRGEAIGHVLGRFPPEQERLVPSLVSVAGDAAIAALRDGPREAMNQFNRDWMPDLEAGTVRAPP